jgi:Protein of unknown function (DUF3435)
MIPILPCRTTFFFYQTGRAAFDLVTLIIALALLDGAFESENVTSVESVFAAQVPDGLEYLPFQWKKEWLKRPIFCGSNDDLSRPMSYRSLHEYIKDHSLEMGYPDAISPKHWRRNVGNTVNRNATGPERDLIMRHNQGSNTFRVSYLNQTVEYDVIAGVLDEPSEDDFLRKLSCAGHARDCRAKKDMVPPEVWAALKKKGEAQDIQDMLVQSDELRAEAKRLPKEQVQRKKELNTWADTLTRRINSRRATEKRHVITRYHKFYFEKAPTRDLDRQLNGEAPIAYIPPTIECQLPERAAVAKLLSEQPAKLDAEQLRSLRIEICSLFVRLGRLRELPRPRTQQFLSKLAAPAPQPSPSPSPVFDSAYYPESPVSSPPSSPSPSPSPPPISPSYSSYSWTDAQTGVVYSDAVMVRTKSLSLALSDSSSYTQSFSTSSLAGALDFGLCQPSSVSVSSYSAPPAIPPSEEWSSSLQYALGWNMVPPAPVVEQKPAPVLNPQSTYYPIQNTTVAYVDENVAPSTYYSHSAQNISSYSIPPPPVSVRKPASSSLYARYAPASQTFAHTPRFASHW